MSYIRFGEHESDVYVYESTRGVHCCLCSLLDPVNLGDQTCEIFRTGEAAAEHLLEHVRRGDVVPEYVVDDVRERTEVWL